ncbi:MAG: metallophosphoesterase [Clostridiales bacterium]|nr:metallophosphoesterase [Clostridiales bacterium]
MMEIQDMGVAWMGRRNNGYIFVEKKKKGPGLGCLVLLLLLIASIAGAAVMINTGFNRRITLETASVNMMGLDKAYEGLTILHISDLHASPVGSDLELWKNLLNGKSYKAVVITGDMVGKSGEYEPFLSLIHNLKQINADAPIYFIAGNEDPTPVLTTNRGTPHVLAKWVLAAQDQGAIYLDRPELLEIGKKKVWFTPQYLYDVDAEGMLSTLYNQKAEMESQGMQYDSVGGATYRALVYRIELMERTVISKREMTDQDLQIAVNHTPLDTDYIRESLQWAEEVHPFSFRNISLLMCGDLCGGGWRLPGGNALYLKNKGWLPGDDGVVGMQRINSLNQYISPGLGAPSGQLLPGRVFNPPAVTLIKFTARLE